MFSGKEGMGDSGYDLPHPFLIFLWYDFLEMVGIDEERKKDSCKFAIYFHYSMSLARTVNVS